jgi:hypothetical protein
VGKFEARNTIPAFAGMTPCVGRGETSSNPRFPQRRKTTPGPSVLNLSISNIVGICFGFRDSDFGFPGPRAGPLSCHLSPITYHFALAFPARLRHTISRGASPMKLRRMGWWPTGADRRGEVETDWTPGEAPRPERRTGQDKTSRYCRFFFNCCERRL